jgi:hypothetical protein
VVIDNDDDTAGANLRDDAFNGIKGILQGIPRRSRRFSISLHLEDQGKCGDGGSQLLQFLPAGPGKAKPPFVPYYPAALRQPDSGGYTLNSAVYLVRIV